MDESPDDATRCLVAEARAVFEDDKHAPNTESHAYLMGDLELLWKIRYTAMVSVIFAFCMTAYIHVFVPYLYTRVRCCDSDGVGLKGDYNVSDPSLVESMIRSSTKARLTVQLEKNRQNLTVIPACAVPQFPARSALWSLSPR